VAVPSALTVPPVVREVGELVEVVDPAGRTRWLQPYERTGRWTLMASLDARGEHLAVFEDFRGEGGHIVYVSRAGVRLDLSKSLVPTRVDERACYGGHDKKTVLGAERDLLREELLAEPGDAEAAVIAGLFPPIRRARHGSVELPHTFLGSPACLDVVPLHYDPNNARPRLNPLVVAPEIRCAIDEERLLEGLIGGWLPAVRVVYPVSADYPVSDDLAWEMLAFAVPEPPTPYLQPVWYRFVKLDAEEVVEAHYFDSYLPYPWPVEPPAEPFYLGLWELHDFWQAHFRCGMHLDLPEAWIDDFCRHSMALEMITRACDHPHYGVVDRAYGGPEHDGFQDVLTSAATCYEEWGLFDVARRYLADYLEHFVRDDGSIDYRGPAIGQYGRMLTILARFSALTGEDALLVDFREKVDALVRVLTARREQAKRRTPDDDAFGMLAGRHEADISFDTATLASMDYERPYFSNSTEAWRGLRDIGRAFERTGRRLGDETLAADGQALVEEAAALACDIDRAIERSWLDRDGIRTLPLIAGSDRLHLDAPYRSCPESFDENRVFSEMLYSGILGREVVAAIVASSSARGDSTLGILGNRTHVVAFTATGTAYGLLQHDLIREFLILYYSHAFHLHTRGTFTAFECVDLDRDRAAHLPYCAPAQVTVPTLTKWMLVFEDPLESDLWLAKATPRRWLENGSHVAVDGAPTSRGPVTFEIRSNLDSGIVEATVELPTGHSGETLLRLRVPGRRPIRYVELDGKPWPGYDPGEEIVLLPPKPAQRVHVVARY
jgi:hypothetical protein